MFCILFSITILINLYGCSSTKALPPLDAKVITSLGDSCKVLYTGHIDAWNSGNAENLRQFYTDDIVHYDGMPLYVGIDDVLSMEKEYMYVKGEAGETYISMDECFGTWMVWNISGFTQDNPGVEYDLMQTREGKISFWRCFYDQHFYESASRKPQYIKNDFLAQYASSWSSGKTNEILKLYSTNAMLEDTLFEISISGKREIGGYANSILGKSSGANWKLLHSFAEGEGDNEYYTYSHGGVFAITVKDSEGNPCEIRAIVLLTPDEEGKIQSQEVFYNADSLLVCGWAK